MASITTSPTRSLFYLFFLCFVYFQHSLLPFTLSVFWEDGCLAVERDRSSSTTSRTRRPTTFASMDRPSGGVSLVGLMSSRGHTEHDTLVIAKFCVFAQGLNLNLRSSACTRTWTKKRCLRPTCRRNKWLPGPSLQYLLEFHPPYRVLVIRLRSRLTHQGIHVHTCNFKFIT